MTSHGHTAPGVWDYTPTDIVADGLRRIRAAGSGYRLALIISAVLGVIGLIALIVGPVLAGYGNRKDWTYVAITFGFLMSTVGSAPALSVATRLVRGHWRRPVNRISEIWAAGMIVPLILFFLLLGVQPGTDDRNSIWFGWPGSPWLWDSILMVALVFTGYALLYVASIPDMAVARDLVDKNENGWFTRLSRQFIGTHRQWKIIDRGVGYLGAFYVVLYVGTMTVLSSDFILSFIPGHNSSIFPATYTITGLGSGIAVVIITAAILRRWGGAADYLGVEQFFAMAKLLLALGLLWFYFNWTEFIIFWYGRTPREVALLKLLYFDTYFWLFAIAFAFQFFAPLAILVWTRVRQSITGPTVAAVFVLVGQFVNQTRLLSASFSTPDIYEHELSALPPATVPGILDIVMTIGLIGGAVALVLASLKLVPYPSIWEVTAGLWLRARKRYHKTEVTLIGKPD